MPSMEFQQRGMEPPLTTTRRPSTAAWKAPPIDKPPLVTPSASSPPSRPYHQHAASTTTGTRPWLAHSARDQRNNNPGSSSSLGRSSPFAHANHNRTSSSVPPRQQSRAPSRVSSTPKPGGFSKSSTPSSSSPVGFRRGSSAAASSSSLRSSVFGNRFSGGGQPDLSDADIEKEREASLMRLMGAWTSLEKYVKRLDEDDIVDLETGKIIKDNGVLKNSRTKKFGVVDEGEEAEEAVEEEEDEFDDQLDTLGDLDDDEDEEGDEGLEIRVPNPVVPPMTPSDARYAEDLRTFLEKEKDIGSEPEDDPDDNYAYEDLPADADGASSEVQSDGVFGLDNHDEGEETDFYDELHPIVSDYPGPGDTDSEDELNCNWAEDEASMIIPVVKDEEPSTTTIDNGEDDSDIEIIEPPLPPKANPASPSKKPAAKLKPVQLFTPPHSRSSVQSPPDDDYATPPPAPVDFSLPDPDISPEIPVTTTNSSGLPPPSSTKSPTTPKKPKSKIFPTSSGSSAFVSRLEAPKSSKHNKEETVFTSDPPPMKFKLKAEVVIERKTPVPQPKPAKETLPPGSLRAGSVGKGKVYKSAEVVDISDSEDEVVTKRRSPTPPEAERKPSKKPASKAKPSTSSSPTPSSSKSKKNEIKEGEVRPPCKPKSTGGKSKATPSSSWDEVEEVVVPVKKDAEDSSPRKRKRNASAGPSTQRDKSPEKKSSSSSKGKGRQTDDGSDAEEVRGSSKSAKAARRSVHERSPRKRRSKSRSRAQSSSSSSESGQERGRHGRDQRSPDTHPHDYYHNSRAGSYIAPTFPPYPSHQASHPFLAPHQQQPHPQAQHNPAPSASSGPSHAPYPSFDPAQMYMFTQMMAAAMSSGQWGMPPPMAPGHPPQHHQYRDPSHPPSSPAVQYPPGPFTSTHPYRRSHSQGPGEGSGHNMQQMYSTPTHNHNHMYIHGGMPHFPGYAMNPDFSRGTAPPDTPESALGSSPIKKSLVERSRSRGRRVSFVDDRGRDRGRSKSKGKTGGKGSRRERSRSRNDSGSDSEESGSEDDEEMVDVGSSPLKGKSREKERRDRDRERGRDKTDEKERSKKPATSSSSNPKSKERRKKRICSPEEVEEVADSEADAGGMASDSSDDTPLSDYSRGRTPGPPEGSPPPKEKAKGKKRRD